MKKQSEAEWLADLIDRINSAWFETVANGTRFHDFAARRLLAALRRRGWRAPKKRANKKRNSLSDTHEHRTGLQM